MGISAKLLSPGENVIASTRTHWKALVVPVLVLIVICAAAGFLIAVLPDGSAHTILLLLVLVVAAAIVIWFTIRPFLVWLTASYTVTNRRLINRSGVFVRKGRDIPLYRINDVSYERGVLDRLLGCGTLVISDASEQGRSVLPDVPKVEQLQLLITDLLFGSRDGADDDGTPKTSLPPTT
jgi:membrane protein YdbS with pleckstrin-like domain